MSMLRTLISLMIALLISACATVPDAVDEPHALSASELVPLLKSGRLSVEDYVSGLLQRYQRLDPSLNAFISVQPEQLLEAARAADRKRQRGETLGPLFGVPIAYKDLINTTELPTSYGTAKYAGFKPQKNAPLVDKLQAAGALMFGKNNTQELAYGSNGYNSHYGQQLNPYKLERIAGGSTGGGAAAVAARMVPIAMGTDTAASIRVPAAFTGLYGLRPSTGRYDNAGIFPIAPTLDTVGPLTRSMQDLALIDSVLSGDARPITVPALAQLRIGVPQAYFHEGISREMAARFADFTKRLEDNGVTLVRVDLLQAGELSDAGLYPILFNETYPSVSRFLQQWADGSSIDELYAALGWDIKALWSAMVMPDATEKIPDAVYQRAINSVMPTMQANYDIYFSEHKLDAMIFPATAHTAPLAKPDNPEQTVIDGETVSIFINDHNSSPGALAGQPGLVMPMAMSSEGLPLGVSLDGPRNKDRELLAVGMALAALLKAPPAPPEPLRPYRSKP